MLAPRSALEPPTRNPGGALRDPRPSSGAAGSAKTPEYLAFLVHLISQGDHWLGCPAEKVATDHEPIGWTVASNSPLHAILVF